MTPEDYRNSVLRSESPDYHGVNDRILHAILGIVTEAGELADVIKKESFYGRKPDKWKLLEELGDCRWYQELLCDELEVTMEEVKEMNIKKLKERYPDQFDDVEVRDYEAEQRAAEVGAIGVVSPGVKELICYAKKGTFGLDFGMFTLCKSSVIDKDLPCPYYKACNKKHELLSKIDQGCLEEEDCWTCGSCGHINPTSAQGCLKCLPSKSPLPKCAGQPNQVPGCSKCDHRMTCFCQWNSQFTNRDTTEPIEFEAHEFPKDKLLEKARKKLIEEDHKLLQKAAEDDEVRDYEGEQRAYEEDDDFWDDDDEQKEEGCVNPDCDSNKEEVHEIPEGLTINVPPIDQEHNTPECFGKAVLGKDDRTQEGADHNYQKCLECLDRGPCVKEVESKVKGRIKCFGKCCIESLHCQKCSLFEECKTI